ncbi:Protein of unknown function [Pyronema omphalodes CBS 100304]|uniref:Uncharacterized protein n=1 Tax=Pyronema omphalodes (strain CBS 100304) TaxID=1076935 RepID=U4LVY8_PYROM|nr:Protein of unknown function [Pyronema omphalodes CBS 100304]
MVEKTSALSSVFRVLHVAATPSGSASRVTNFSPAHPNFGVSPGLAWVWAGGLVGLEAPAE